MLVLKRKPGESIFIGNNIQVMVLKAKDGSVSLGVKAPREIPVYRIPEHQMEFTDKEPLTNEANVP